MISSVQNIQTTLINAPDNVIGMVKGVSELVLSNDSYKSSPPTTTGSSSSLLSLVNNNNNNNSYNNSNSSHGDLQRPRYQSLQTHSSSMVSSSNAGGLVSSTPNNKELIDKTVLNDDDMVGYFLK